jgi:hypothetical protein
MNSFGHLTEQLPLPELNKTVCGFLGELQSLRKVMHNRAITANTRQCGGGGGQNISASPPSSTINHTWIS